MSEELTFFDSVDTVSALLARLLFAAYLLMTIILLINMFIALLSNTYQKVQVSDRFTSGIVSVINPESLKGKMK